MVSKTPRQTPSNPNTAYAVMIVAAIAVLALVGWALSRSLNPPVTATAVAAPVDTTSPLPPPAASSAPVGDEEAAKAAIPRVSPADLRQRIEKNEVTVIDVRDKESYDSGHIKGAMHIPLASTEAYLSYVPRDKPIVTYCT